MEKQDIYFADCNVIYIGKKQRVLRFTIDGTKKGFDVQFHEGNRTTYWENCHEVLRLQNTPKSQKLLAWTEKHRDIILRQLNTPTNENWWAVTQALI